MLPRVRLGGAVAIFGLCWVGLNLAAAGGQHALEVSPEAEHAIEIIADVAAIQVRCWDLIVRPGIAFARGEENGVHMLEVMPGGRLRAIFERFFKATSQIDEAQLCGPIAAAYAHDLPGVIDRR